MKRINLTGIALLLAGSLALAQSPPGGNQRPTATHPRPAGNRAHNTTASSNIPTQAVGSTSQRGGTLLERQAGSGSGSHIQQGSGTASGRNEAIRAKSSDPRARPRSTNGATAPVSTT